MEQHIHHISVCACQMFFFIVVGAVCNNLFPLVFTRQADSGGCGSAAQPHQALSDETHFVRRQDTLKM